MKSQSVEEGNMKDYNIAIDNMEEKYMRELTTLEVAKILEERTGRKRHIRDVQLNIKKYMNPTIKGGAFFVKPSAVNNYIEHIMPYIKRGRIPQTWRKLKKG